MRGREGRRVGRAKGVFKVGFRRGVSRQGRGWSGKGNVKVFGGMVKEWLVGTKVAREWIRVVKGAFRVEGVID